MRLIDADELKEKLLKMQKDIINGSSDTWEAAYLSVFDKYIKMLDDMPRVISGRDAGAILDAYGKGYSKGREDALSEVQQMEDYCKNDCDTIYEAYARGCSNGYLEGISNTLKGMLKEKKDE